MIRRGNILMFALVLTAASLPAPAVMAQTGTSTISGVVRDPTGAPLPGASVNVVNEETGVTYETVSNGEGLYRAPALVPGRYRIEIRLEGFDTAVRRSLTLEVSQTLAVDVTLRVAGQTEMVHVSGGSQPIVETQSSNVTQTVSRQMLEALPLPNRSASALAALAPGVIMIDTGGGTAENYPVFSVARAESGTRAFNSTAAMPRTRSV